MKLDYTEYTKNRPGSNKTETQYVIDALNSTKLTVDEKKAGIIKYIHMYFKYIKKYKTSTIHNFHFKEIIETICKKYPDLLSEEEVFIDVNNRTSQVIDDMIRISNEGKKIPPMIFKLAITYMNGTMDNNNIGENNFNSITINSRPQVVDDQLAQYTIPEAKVQIQED